MEHWIYLLIFGAIAGWLAGFLMKGSGYGLLGNIILGIVGSLVGGWLFNTLNVHIASGFLGALIEAVIGATAIIFIAGLFRR